MTPLLSVKDLRVTFETHRGPVEAVRGVSFDLGRERLGIVGESGSGKSQTGRALLRLSAGNGRVSADKMEFDGIDLMTASERKMRAIRGARISMIMQDPRYSLNPVVKVGDQIAEAFLVHSSASKREARARAMQALEDVGLGIEMRFRYPYQISGGQRQRIAIARALILEPEILLLDEPTSALDVSVQAEILNLLRRIQRERGLTYLMVSHDLAVVAHMCERVAVMNRGRFAEVVTTEQLRSGTPTQDYTKQLLTASGRYDRDVAKSFVSFD
ncbi:UNVERIFIED_CONTAM: hypothetical protein GTU68_024268 [Idotea baltica]|nr:hypothetical protein [Idotea baltica]